MSGDKGEPGHNNENSDSANSQPELAKDRQGSRDRGDGAFGPPATDTPSLALRLPLAGQPGIEIIGAGTDEKSRECRGSSRNGLEEDPSAIPSGPSGVVTPLITQERLRMMLDGMCLPAAMDKFLDGQPGHFVGSPHLSPAMRRLGVQLQSNPYSGDLGDLYTYGKLFEIIAIALDDLASENEAGGPIARAERLKISRVCELLMDSLAHPPTQQSLAKEVGLSQRRLTRLFRDVTGKTITAWIVEHKLIMAGDMLRESTLSIKEIAHLTGYAHQSTFAEAFIKKFGLSPKAYRETTSASQCR